MVSLDGTPGSTIRAQSGYYHGMDAGLDPAPGTRARLFGREKSYMTKDVWRMKHLALVGLVVAALGGGVRGVFAQELNIYLPPECELDMQHFLVRNAALYVKAATEARSPEQRARSTQDAARVLGDAVERGEDTNAAVWYFLGRNYALIPDLAGADSAFARAERLAPECADDIDQHRRFLWVPLYNTGITAMQNNDTPAAREALSQADSISDKEPNIPYYLATILVNEDENEEAIRLFKKTVAMGQSEGEYRESYLTSYFNTARLYHLGEEWDSAAAWYDGYRELVPDDPQALHGLASVLAAAGRRAEALAAYDSILAHAGVISALDLFSTGVSLFQYERFDLAAQAFTHGLAKNRFYRDGVFNLTQSYFALANPNVEEDSTVAADPEELARRNQAAAKMLEAATRLVDIDPLNESSMRLLAAAYQLMGQQDSTVALLERIESLSYEITVERFQPANGGYYVQGRVSNLREEDVTVPDVVFEFVDAEGNVVATETIGGTRLNPEGTTEFEFTPLAEAVAAWRYRTEG